MNWLCSGCERSAKDDIGPWLLITGWRNRVPIAALLCPDCEKGAAYLADELHDLIGVRLPDYNDSSIRTALRGWPSLPHRGGDSD